MKNLFKSHNKKSGASSHLSWRHYSTDTFIYSTETSGQSKKSKKAQKRAKDKSELSGKPSGKFNQSELIRRILKADLLSMGLMSVVIVFWTSIAAVVFAMIVDSNKKIQKEQEEELLILLQEHAGITNLVKNQENLPDQEKINDLAINVSKVQGDNNGLVVQQNQNILKVEDDFNHTKDESKNISVEYDEKLDDLVQTQTEVNETFTETLEMIKNISNETKTFKTNMDQELDNQKTEYMELHQKQQEKVDAMSSSIEQQQDSSHAELKEKIEEQNNSIQNLSSKQNDLEVSLNGTQQEINNHTQEINNLQETVVVLEND